MIHIEIVQHVLAHFRELLLLLFLLRRGFLFEVHRHVVAQEEAFELLQQDSQFVDLDAEQVGERRSGSELSYGLLRVGFAAVRLRDWYGVKWDLDGTGAGVVDRKQTGARPATRRRLVARGLLTTEKTGGTELNGLVLLLNLNEGV